ncbi:NACHT domain-containing protein [Streptomyces sp. NBC_00258]|uniref:NACHT domain-containing protein n=1 Tax=Streptomyces sp. NBC_00258 TaxID=2903642 RepID=UPI002E2C5247|nr:NACHT domain-containing protein [Streptomyces sp. NBC_00258]
MLAEVAAGVIVEAVAATARWLRRETASTGGHDHTLIRWFDTYQLSPTGNRAPELPDELPAQPVEEFLRCDDSQAVLHELLAARLTDAPESVIVGLRESYVSCARCVLGPHTVTEPLPDHDAVVGALAAEFFDYCDLEIATLVGQLASSDPVASGRVRQEAFSARITAVLGAIERHTRALTLRDSACLAADQAFVAAYRRQAAYAHGSLEPPDFERRRRVPIDALHVSPDMERVDENRVAPDGPTLGIPELDRAVDRTVLLGDPGCGKSTTCQVLMHRRASDPQAPLPFLVVLRDFALAEGEKRSVVDYIEHRLETYYQCPAPSGAVDRLLLSGTASILFDGLDELVDSARRREVTEVVELVCARYPLAPVLVTSRIVGYGEARLDDRLFECFRLGPFGPARTAEYVTKWFAQEEGTPHEAEEHATSFLAESASLTDLRANPLMLALMCILYRGTGSIPRSRPEVYEQCASLLFQKWDVRRRIHVELAMSRLVEPALRHLALWLFTRDDEAHAVTERELVDRAVEFLDGRGYEARAEAEAAAKQFVNFCRGRAWVFSEVGTTARGERLFTFTHRTFLEYFAAAQLASTSDTPEILARRLAPKVSREEWDIVGQLAVQIKERATADGAARFFTALLGERRRRSATGRGNILAFLARCLSCVDPPPSVVRRLTRAAVDHLMLGDPESEDFSRPLGELVKNCWSSRDLVADELAGAIAEAVGSSDAVRKRSGLLLAGYVAVPSNEVSSAVSAFWWEFVRRTVGEYAAEFLAAAPDDIGLMDVCLGHELADLGDFFDEWGLEFGSLFESWPMGIFGRGHAWSPYAARCVFVLLIGGPGCRPAFETTLRDCAAVGAWVREHPDPPWVGRAEDVSHFLDYIVGELAAGESRVHAALDSDGFLGAAVLLLTSLEVSSEPPVDRLSAVLGPLTALFPYAEARCNGGDGDLPDLPVPDGFGELLRAWARHGVNFSLAGGAVRVVTPSPAQGRAQ